VNLLNAGGLPTGAVLLRHAIRLDLLADLTTEARVRAMVD